MKVHSKTHVFNADTYTPVGLYNSLRFNYRNCCLLESNDYHSRQDSRSIIGFESIIEVIGDNHQVKIISENSIEKKQLVSTENSSKQLQQLLQEYEFSPNENNGFIGRLGFEFNHYQETNELTTKTNRIPVVHLFLFRYILVIDHFTNDGFLIENSLNQEFHISEFSDLKLNLSPTQLPFELIGNERALISDQDFYQLVLKGIQHCQRGDVFQLVLSNEFQQSFFGDDFQVYRQLRRLNPSPYLYYFDFEHYRLFGSSPEAQLINKKGVSEIHPIAGTIPRTGIEETDQQQLQFLLEDIKENAEHTMLVDLARNDLSRDCRDVKVQKYKEVQNFSHVTHLVSKVTGKLKHKESFTALVNSFPAGTLSGTPKPKALKLIDQYEPISRDYYGGAVGLIQPNGDINTAIVIRSILSMNNTLHYRAGAGVVIDSIPHREVEEVHHKLKALRTAIHKTQYQFQPIQS